MKITIISSSTRKGRLSHRIALALKSTFASLNIDYHILDLADLQLPAFSERFDFVDDRPESWATTMEALITSDGLIFLTPEYNGSISSGLKNFIDVFAKKGFVNKPIGVATGSTGAMGGIRAAYQLQQIILSLGAFPHPRMLTVGKMDQVISPEGQISDDRTEQSFVKFAEVFSDFARKLS